MPSISSLTCLTLLIDRNVHLHRHTITQARLLDSIHQDSLALTVTTSHHGPEQYPVQVASRPCWRDAPLLVARHHRDSAALREASHDHRPRRRRSPIRRNGYILNRG